MLQAKPGEESNLLTVTKDGQVYSYILKYSKELPKLNYFIHENESIGSEQSESIKQKPIVESLNEDANRIIHFQKISEYLWRTRVESLATKRQKGMKISLQKMVYDASEVYLVLEIKNKSGIDFEVDYLKVYRTNGNEKRKASYQSLEQEVLYQHNMPQSVSDAKSERFIYVLPKFVLGNNEKLMLELKELKGSRKVVLETRL
uniref:DUF4138 domain-containing protein n=1 Tax=Aureibaculum algae TaxID=2584122 RepID=UPI0026AFF802|nr:DUF4138 domain-containing protein [Aureibaculum algae]